MFRRTFTGSLVAASLTAGALLTMPAAQAAPTWVGADSVSGETFLPTTADVAVADNGDAVATWIAGGRVLASSAAHGSWGAPEFVSDAGKTVHTPAVALNSQGDAAITWSQTDQNDNERLAVSRRLPGGDWDGWALISPTLDKSVATRADVGLDAQGTLRAAYVATDGGSFNQVRVATQARGSDSYSTANLSDSDAFAPSLAVNAAGTVLVSWMDVEGPESLIRSRRLPSPDGSWTTAKDVSPLGSYGADTETALSDSGFGTIAFVRGWNGDQRAEAAKVQADNFIGSASFVSPSGEDASQIALDQNDAGTALLSWIATGDTTEVGFATRKQTSDWSAGQIDAPVSQPQAPRSGIADNGTVLVGYVGNGHLLGSYRTNPLLPLSKVDSGDQDIVSGSTLMGMDDQGNAFLGAVKDLGGGLGEVRGAFLDAAGPTVSMTAPAQSLAPKFGVSWAASDRLSNVATGSVRVRSAAFNGGFGGYTYPLVSSAAKALAFTGAPGRTYCFSGQAKDAVGNLSAWSAERCTTVPLDDRSLTRVKGFKTRTGSAHYLGTFVQAKKKGSKLTLTNVKANRIAVIVSKAAKGGKIKVSFAGKSLGTYNLKGKGSKQLVAVKNLGSLKTGTLVIKVVSKSGKVVRIDGVVLAK
jgi:hypothetical protein